MVFVILVALGVYGVIAAARSYIDHEKSVAVQIARDASIGFEVRKKSISYGDFA